MLLFKNLLFVFCCPYLLVPPSPLLSSCTDVTAGFHVCNGFYCTRGIAHRYCSLHTCLSACMYIDVENFSSLF